MNERKENVNKEEENGSISRKLLLMKGKRKTTQKKETEEGIEYIEGNKEGKELEGSKLEDKGKIRRTIEELNKGGKNKEENMKINKRGRKKQSERGILKGEQSILDFMKAKEGKENGTPKRKFEEGGKEGNEIVFGLCETPSKKLRSEFDVGRRKEIGNIFEKGKVKRMKEKYEVGGEKEENGIGMFKHSEGRKVHVLRKEGKESLGRKNEPVHEVNEIKSKYYNFSDCLKNGVFNRKKLGFKNDFKKETDKIVHQDASRWGGKVSDDAKSVPANQNYRNDAVRREPITDEMQFQLGTRRERGNSVNL